jgi:hypothetical protein
MIKILHNLCSFILSQKRQFFADFLGENILKIITSVPGHPHKATLGFVNFYNAVVVTINRGLAPGFDKPNDTQC